MFSPNGLLLIGSGTPSIHVALFRFGRKMVRYSQVVNWHMGVLSGLPLSHTYEPLPLLKVMKLRSMAKAILHIR